MWSPDGTHIAFASQRSGKVSLRQKLLNGTAADELLLEGPGDIAPTGWSRDGRFIAYVNRSSGNNDLWVLPLSGDRKPFPLVQTAFDENAAVFTPDGRWIAYSSAESGQRNIYVQSFPGTGAKYQISRDGGSQPIWRADGKEMFYLGADGTLMSVPIEPNDQFSGVPRALFRTAASLDAFLHQYAVTKDGQRILVSASTQRSDEAPLTVVINWRATIRK